MYASRLRQMVIEDNPDAVAFVSLNGRSWSAPVEAPEIESSARYDHLLHGFRSQIKHLDAVVHRKWQISDIRRHDRRRDRGIALSFPCLR